MRPENVSPTIERNTSGRKAAAILSINAPRVSSAPAGASTSRQKIMPPSNVVMEAI
jgi:hypothetical protein